MGKNAKRGRGRRDWKNQNAQNSRSGGKQTDNKNIKLRDAAVQRHLYENIAAQKKKDEAIRELKQRCVVCLICGKDIEDMASAVVDKASGNPAHSRQNPKFLLGFLLHIPCLFLYVLCATDVS